VPILRFRGAGESNPLPELHLGAQRRLIVTWVSGDYNLAVMDPVHLSRRQFVVGLVAFVPVGALWAQTAASKPSPNSCVAAKVKQTVFDQFGAEATRKMRFKQDLEADSLDSVEFTVALERSFEIHIPDKDCARLHTVGSVIDYLSARLTPKQISKACSGNR